MPAVKIMTPEEYLAAERLSPTKHELINGEVWAMAGVSRWHGRISINLASLLHNSLRTGNCSAATSDLRVGIPATEAFVYPDIVVYCGEGQWRDDTFDTLEDPILVIEILSPSTALYDRNTKFKNYRTIDSLRHYVLVEQDYVNIELYSRDTEGRWLLREYNQLEQSFEVPSLGISIPLNLIYERVPARVGLPPHEPLP